MPAEIDPPELARVVAFAERPRAGDWSLRAALCRYAQPQPRRVGQVLELVRRIDGALHPYLGRLDRDGPAIWDALRSGVRRDGVDAQLLALLTAAEELDRLGDELADWAVDRTGTSPEDAVDDAVGRVTRLLDDAGVPREERQRPPARSRG